MNMIITTINDYIVNAMLDNNKLVRLSYEEKKTERNSVDSVFIGKVNNIVKNINAAFINISSNDICFMQYPADESITSIHNEEELPVQIVHGKIKTKQAAVSTHIKLTGRYLIRTGKHEIAVSKKIKSNLRKNELAEFMKKTDENNSGYIIRTNAENASFEQLKREYNHLEKLYSNIMNKAKYSKAYSCIYNSPQDYICSIRDGYDKEIDRIITDSKEVYDNIYERFNDVYPEITKKLEFYSDDYPLWALYGLKSKIEKACSEKIWLDSGAYIIIQITEACTVIDVNTGKAVKNKKNIEKNFYDINKEAAEEIFLQLGLRNLSGIIIIDFIDMKTEEYNAELFSYIKKLADKDPVKTNVIDFTALGLVEITRKKISAPTDFRKISF